MKKNYLFLLLLICAPLFSFSQLAINTTGAEATSSAMLEIQSNDKGILIPKMVISSVTDNTSPINLPADGLLIYNTGGAGVPEGFYYWARARWNLMTNDLTALTSSQTSQLYETAEMYENNDFNTPTNIELPNNASYYGWVSAAQGETFGNSSTDVAHATADQIIVGEDGLYELEISTSFGGSQNVQVKGVVFHTPNGGSATESRIQFLRKIGSTGDLGSASAHGLLRLNAGDALDIRFNSTSNGEDIDIYSLNFIVNKVGEL